MAEIKPDRTPSVRSVPSDPEKEINTTVDGNFDGNEYIDPKIERSLVRKFDFLILPMCGESSTQCHLSVLGYENNIESEREREEKGNM